MKQINISIYTKTIYKTNKQETSNPDKKVTAKRVQLKKITKEDRNTLHE